MCCGSCAKVKTAQFVCFAQIIFVRACSTIIAGALAIAHSERYLTRYIYVYKVEYTHFDTIPMIYIFLPVGVGWGVNLMESSLIIYIKYIYSAVPWMD